MNKLREIILGIMATIVGHTSPEVLEMLNVQDIEIPDAEPTDPIREMLNGLFSDDLPPEFLAGMFSRHGNPFPMPRGGRKQRPH